MTAGLRELKKARVREQIVQTTIDLVRKRGYERTTVEEISGKVEITTPTFYNYFSSKEAVLGRVYAEAVRAWATTIDEQLAQDASLEFKLRALASEMAVGMLADAKLWKAVVLSGAINPALDEAQREAESLAEGSLRIHISPIGILPEIPLRLAQALNQPQQLLVRLVKKLQEFGVLLFGEIWIRSFLRQSDNRKTHDEQSEYHYRATHPVLLFDSTLQS